MTKILEQGKTYTGKEIADWMNISAQTFANNK